MNWKLAVFEVAKQLVTAQNREMSRPKRCAQEHLACELANFEMLLPRLLLCIILAVLKCLVDCVLECQLYLKAAAQAQ